MILTKSDGHGQTFKTDDAFLVPNGFDGTQEVVETTHEDHVILNDPPHAEAVQAARLGG